MHFSIQYLHNNDNYNNYQKKKGENNNNKIMEINKNYNNKKNNKSDNNNNNIYKIEFNQKEKIFILDKHLTQLSHEQTNERKRRLNSPLFPSSPPPLLHSSPLPLPPYQPFSFGIIENNRKSREFRLAKDSKEGSFLPRHPSIHPFIILRGQSPSGRGRVNFFDHKTRMISLSSIDLH